MVAVIRLSSLQCMKNDYAKSMLKARREQQKTSIIIKWITKEDVAIFLNNMHMMRLNQKN